MKLKTSFELKTFSHSAECWNIFIKKCYQVQKEKVEIKSCCFTNNNTNISRRFDGNQLYKPHHLSDNNNHCTHMEQIWGNKLFLSTITWRTILTSYTGFTARSTTSTTGSTAYLSESLINKLAHLILSIWIFTSSAVIRVIN